MKPKECSPPTGEHSFSEAASNLGQKTATARNELFKSPEPDYTFFMFIPVFTALLIGPNWALAAELATTEAPSVEQGAPRPRCVQGQDEINAIVAHAKSNAKNRFKYDRYRQALQSDSDTELLARLAYSEVVAANCPGLEFKIAPLIVQTIANRARIRKGDVRSVVFQRDQFASSLNIYASSRYKDFLCPQDEKLWSAILNEAKTALRASQPILRADTVNYFLYKHDPRWKKEPWKLKEDRSRTSPELRECVRFFSVPRWK